MDGERQLRVQRRDRPLGFSRGLSGPDEHPEPERPRIRTGIRRLGPGQRVHERQVALQAERHVFAAARYQRRG